MSNEEVDQYGDDRIASADAPIPGWLRWSYLILFIWGIWCFYTYWNGSVGWFDRGYWAELQRVANTKYPFKDHDQTK